MEPNRERGMKPKSSHQRASSKDMRHAYDDFLKNRQQRVDAHLSRLRAEEEQATASAALMSVRRATGAVNLLGPSMQRPSASVDPAGESHQNTPQPPCALSSSPQLVSNSKSNKTAIRKEEASEAAPSHLRILVESVLHPFTAYPYLDPALLERYFSLSLEPQAAIVVRSSEDADKRLQRQLWRTLHGLVFYCVRELSTTSDDASIDVSQLSTDEPESNEDLCVSHAQTCPTRVRSRTTSVRKKQPSENDRCASLSAAEWLFALQCLSEWGYPRQALFVQSSNAGDVCELLAAILWLCKMFQLPLVATHISLVESCTSAAISAQKDGDNDCDDDSSVVVSPNPIVWPPGNFNELEAADQRMRQIQKLCEPLSAAAASESQQQLYHGIDDDSDDDESKDREEEGFKLQVKRSKILLKLHRQVRLSTNRILSLLQTRCDQIVALGAVHALGDYALCLPRNASKYEKTILQLERVAKVHESSSCLLSALRECGKVLLSHMTLRHGDDGTKRTDAQYLIRSADLKQATDDSLRRSCDDAEQMARFASLCVGDGRGILTSAQDQWHRVSRQIVRDNRNGQAIVEDVDRECAEAVMRSMHDQYTLQSCLLSELASQSLQEDRQVGRCAAAGGLQPPQSTDATPPPPSSLIAATALDKLLRSPLLTHAEDDVGSRRSAKSNNQQSRLSQETLVGVPAPGKSTSAAVEFSRLRAALVELEKSQPSSNLGFEGLAAFLSSNGLRTVPRKTFSAMTV